MSAELSAFYKLKRERRGGELNRKHADRTEEREKERERKGEREGVLYPSSDQARELLVSPAQQIL